MGEVPTGPMIVACQWNCALYISVPCPYISQDLRQRHRQSHAQMRPMLVESGAVLRTRSSPTGPAEHDEGGSLREENNLLAS